MQDKMLRALLGEDYDQLDAEALKVRLGERQKDFNPQRIPTPISNEEYAPKVDEKARDYFNSRVDNLQKAVISDRNPNATNRKLVEMLSKKYNIDAPKYKEEVMSGLAGGYDPTDDTLKINPEFNKDQQLSTVIHEMKHAKDDKKGLTPLLLNINDTSLPNQVARPPQTNDPIPKSIMEGTLNVDAGQVEDAILKNDFPKVSEYYNRGHFMGNDQVEDIADQIYNPIGFEKLKAKLKGN